MSENRKDKKVLELLSLRAEDEFWLCNRDGNLG